MKTKTIILSIAILVIIDQAIKIIIDNFFFDYNIEIIPSLFEFKPVFNQKHSYVNFLLSDNFNISFGLLPHLILFFFVAIIITIMYDFFRSFINSKLLDFAFVLFIAGWLCSLIGNLLWAKGTLDYIYLKPLFVFDLKDIYINCFTILLCLSLLKNRSKLEGIRMKNFISYIKKRIRMIKN